MLEGALIVAAFVIFGAAFFLGRSSKKGSGWKMPYDPNTDVTRGNQDSKYDGP